MLCIIYQHDREEFISTKLTGQVLEVGYQLITSLVDNVLLRQVGLLHSLLSQVYCIVSVKRHLVAKDESVGSLRVGEMFILCDGVM